MSDTRARTHPLVVVAATAVILTCLIAIGVMTGMLPTPLAKERAERAAQGLSWGPAPTVPDAQKPSTDAYAPVPPLTASREERHDGGSVSPPPAAIGSTTEAPSSRNAESASAPPLRRECRNCGSVVSVRAIKEQGEAGMIGPAAGGLVGGLVGHSIGNGRGNTIATVLGAAGGAAAGTEIERRYKAKTRYVVAVRMNDGRIRNFNYASAPGVETGDKVRVARGKLIRD